MPAPPKPPCPEIVVTHLPDAVLFLCARDFPEWASAPPAEVAWSVEGDALWVWPQDRPRSALGVAHLDHTALGKLQAGRGLWIMQAAHARSGYTLDPANRAPRRLPAS